MKLFKSGLSVLLCLCMLFTSIIPAIATDNEGGTVPESTVLYGDADVDGDVDMQDLLLMEKHIAGKDVTISELHADVNADGYINKTDAQMLRDYLVGNIDSLCPDLVTVSFDTNGGGDFEPIQVGRGYGIVKDLPTPAKPDYIFTGWLKSDGSEFYKEDAITEDTTLVAQYESVNKQEELKIDSFAVTDCETDVKFNVTGDFSNSDQVKENITLVPKDGTDPVEIKVEDNGDGTFSIGATVSFTPGASYELALGEGLYFVDKEQTIRSVDFVIKKTEGDRLYYNEKVEFIKDTEEMVYTIEGKEGTQDVLEAALLNNDESNDDIKGTFVMSGGGVAKDDIVCIYTGTDPRERDYTIDANNNYDGEAIAYVRITKIDGNTYSFESLDNDDIDEVLLMPDSIPFHVADLPTGEVGSVYKETFDADARSKLGYKVAPEYKKGDFLIFYTDAFENLTADSDVVYGQVTDVSENMVRYKIVSKKYIEEFMGLFVKNDIDKDKILENLNEKELLKDVAKQAEESGFAEESAGYMLQSAMQDKEVEEAMLNNGMTKKEFDSLATSADFSANPSGIPVGRTKVEMEQAPIILPELIKGEQFENGVGVRLNVSVVFSLSTRLDKVVTALKLDLNASFTQEIAFGIDVDVDDKWKWYGPIPVPEELSAYTSIDIQSYTHVSVSATMYSVHEHHQKKTWKALNEKFKQDPWIYAIVKQYDQLAMKVHQNKKKNESIQLIIEQMEDLVTKIGKIVVDGEEMKYDEVCETLEAKTVSSSFADNAQAEDEAEAQISMQNLVDKYSDLMENESDWVQLAYYELFDKDFNIKVVAINVKVTLVVRGNINLSLGADLEYKVGKRYNFWINCVSCTAGSSEQDLVDERFAIRLYVMGTIGIRAGAKAEINIGIISTKLGSIGASIEFGPYLKIWGYFCYTYTRLRPANSSLWESDNELSGAIYLEFGLYVTVRFKAQVFDDLFKFEPTLYDGEFMLLTAGKLKAVYDFANDHKDESLKIVDFDNYSANGIEMTLPESYRLMKEINLRTGEQTQSIYDDFDFNFNSTNRYFRVNDSGVVTVEVPNGAEYLTGEIEVTWKNSKLGFTNYDIVSRIPVYWTNLTDDQIKQKHTATVVIGNVTDGYNKKVWSGKYSRLDTFDLPSEAEILELIRYDSFNDSNGENLMYGEVQGYTDASTNLTIKEDTEFYFDLTRQKYTIKVNGVQNPDGSTYTKTYQAYYGDTVNFKDLKDTGADNPEKSLYTIFSNVSKKIDDEEIDFGSELKIDMVFAKEYGRNVELTANYSDYSATATFTFEGIKAEPVKVKFRKGEKPYYAGLQNYIEKNGGRYKDVYPPIEKVEHSVTYIVTCENLVPAPKYKLTFDAMNGMDNEIQFYTVGSKVFEPHTPNKTGYIFSGWYTDKEYTNEFNFESMPDHDTTVYAKWNAIDYKVTYKVSDGNIVEKIIPFDQAIDLSSPGNTDTKRFLYWCYESNNQRVPDNAKVDGDIVLVAKWASKGQISIKTETQQYTDIKEQPFKVILDGEHPNFDETVKFRCEYKKQTSDNYTDVVPSEKGVYDVKITRDTDSYFEEFEIKLIGALIIGKIDLSLKDPIPEPTGSEKETIFTKGNTLVIGRPEGYKGDGKIIFTAVHEVSEEKHTSPTGVFNNLPEGTYLCSVTVEEGTYYDEATTNTVRKTVKGVSPSGNYSYSVDVKTGNENGSGTYNTAFVRLDYRGNTSSDWANLGDPDRNSTISRNISSSVYPWAIDGYAVKLNKESVFYGSDNWHCMFVKVNVKEGSQIVKSEKLDLLDSRGEWIDPNKNKSKSTSKFKRNIILHNDDTKYFNGEDKVKLYGNDATQNYSYDYSGKVIDQYHSNKYDPMPLYSPPTFSVTASNSDLLRYVIYTGTTSFKLDLDGIREYKQRTDQPSFYYTVNYVFPSETCTSTTFKKSIYVDTSTSTSVRKKAVLSTGASQINSGLYSTGASQINNGLYSTDVSQSNNTVIVDKVDGYEGKEVTVPVKLQGSAPFWGLLANVEFDNEVLQFAGFENNRGMYTPAEYTTQNDLTKSFFRFLVANDELENVTPDGNLINLKFRVKKDTPHQAYNVSVDVIQSVNVDGDVNNVDVSDGWVNVTEKPTSPAEKEPSTGDSGNGTTPGTQHNDKDATDKTDDSNDTQQQENGAVIPDGDINRTLVMVLSFVLLASGALVVLLRKREDRI